MVLTVLGDISYSEGPRCGKFGDDKLVFIALGIENESKLEGMRGMVVGAGVGESDSPEALEEESVVVVISVISGCSEGEEICSSSVESKVLGSKVEFVLETI